MFNIQLMGMGENPSPFRQGWFNFDCLCPGTGAWEKGEIKGKKAMIDALKMAVHYEIITTHYH